MNSDQRRADAAHARIFLARDRAKRARDRDKRSENHDTGLKMQNPVKHRVIIAGGRDFLDSYLVKTTLQRLFPNPQEQVDYVISGNARGADMTGEAWAIANVIPVMLMPAQWSAHGKSAGPIRNAAMAKRGTYLIAFWDGKSRGTKNMIDTATKAGLTVHVEKYE